MYIQLILIIISFQLLSGQCKSITPAIEKDIFKSFSEDTNFDEDFYDESPEVEEGQSNPNLTFIAVTEQIINPKQRNKKAKTKTPITELEIITTTVPPATAAPPPITTTTTVPTTTTTVPTTIRVIGDIDTTIVNTLTTTSVPCLNCTSTQTPSSGNNTVASFFKSLDWYYYLLLLLIIPIVGIFVGAYYYCKRKTKKDGYVEPRRNMDRRFSTPSWVFSEPDFADEEITTLEEEKK